jgi:hypothetical protein
LNVPVAGEENVNFEVEHVGVVDFLVGGRVNHHQGHVKVVRLLHVLVVLVHDWVNALQLHQHVLVVLS